MNESIDSVVGPRWTIGKATIIRVVENVLSTAPRDLLPLASAERIALDDWARPWSVNETGDLVLAIQTFGIEIAGKKILVDTCFGPGPLPKHMAARCNDGSFLVTLGEAGFGRDDVDVVVCTHLHVDHVGWNTMVDGGRRVPTFRNARYVISRAEYEYWSGLDDANRSAAAVEMFDSSVATLIEFGVADLVESRHRINEFVSLMPTPGHTPGHASVLVASGGEEAVITGDCVHSPVQFAHPEWYTSIDFDREASCATRARLIERFADSHTLVIGTHFPAPTAGRLVSTERGVQFELLANRTAGAGL